MGPALVAHSGYSIVVRQAYQHDIQVHIAERLPIATAVTQLCSGTNDLCMFMARERYMPVAPSLVYSSGLLSNPNFGLNAQTYSSANRHARRQESLRPL